MRMAGVPRVSLIVPVYNPGPYLRECLDSIAAQDLPAGDLEVVLVDDGSTDGSAAILDEFAAAHDHALVIHQENSGWPGRPRNVALDAARGEHVFFMDADDVLGPEALRRLADFADEHDSDIVVPKMVGIGGHAIEESVYGRTAVDADLRLAFRTISPQKLFRRALIDDHGLRFPEGVVRLEDGMVVAKAYLTARRVSVLADYDAYYKRTREDGGNISATLGDPVAYIGAIATVIDIIREHAADRTLGELLALDLYERKALRRFEPERFVRYRARRAKAWSAAVRDLAETRIPPGLEDRLAFDVRLRSRLVRRGDRRALRALLEHQLAGADLPAAVRRGRIELTLPHRGGPLDVTRDVALASAVSSLRAGRRHVDVEAAVRLAGVRVARLPLAVSLGEGDGAPRRRVDAEPGADGWVRFWLRLPREAVADGDDAADDRAAAPIPLVAQVRLAGDAVVAARLCAVAAIPEQDRTRGTAAARAAVRRLAGHPGVREARRRAGADAVARGAVRAVRRARRASRAGR